MESSPAPSSAVSTDRDQDPEFVHRAFSSIAKRYVFTNHCLSLGIDVWWRKKVARLISQENPQVILDVATGSGDLALAIQKVNFQARVIATDFCAPMLEEAKKRELPDLLVADGLNLPFEDNSIDALSIGYGLRNMADWSAALTEFSRVLKPGGRLVVLDFSLPARAILRRPYRFYLHRVLPGIAGLLTGNREAYAYLGDSIERFPSGDAMLSLITENGFEKGDWYPQMGGISSVYTAKVPVKECG